MSELTICMKCTYFRRDMTGKVELAKCRANATEKMDYISGIAYYDKATLENCSQKNTKGECPDYKAVDPN